MKHTISSANYRDRLECKTLEVENGTVRLRHRVKRQIVGHPVKQQGFILVATLWVLVVVTIAAGYFAERVERAIDITKQLQKNTQSALDRSDTRAEVLFRLGTTSLSPYGLGLGTEAIALDNRLYQGLGNSLIKMQDNRGLININQNDDATLSRLLGILEISSDQRGGMIDTLRDYIDIDNLHRLNGAEAQDYAEQGLAPPANAPLITQWEAKRIMGWNRPGLWKDNQFISLTTTSKVNGINPNTAPARALIAALGVTNEMAQYIIKRRSTLPFLDANEALIFIGGAPELYRFSLFVFPSDSIRITQFTQDGRAATQFNVSITADSNDAPWRIDYYMHTNDLLTPAEILQANRLPPRSTLPPALPPQPFGA